MISLADFVFVLNSFIWSLGLGAYMTSHFLVRRHKDKADVRRGITGAMVVGYVCYGYIEVAASSQDEVDPRHWVGIVVGLAFLVSSMGSFTKSISTRTGQGDYYHD